MIKLQDYKAQPIRKPSKEVNIVWQPSVSVQFRQCSGTAQTLLLVTRAKCPTKNQYQENPLTKEMESALRRNLVFVVYPKKSQEELSLPAANP